MGLKDVGNSDLAQGKPSFAQLRFVHPWLHATFFVCSDKEVFLGVWLEAQGNLM